MASACVCNGWNCGAGSGREVEVASLAAREGRSDIHMEAACGAALKFRSWLNANLKGIAKNEGRRGWGDILAVERSP